MSSPLMSPSDQPLDGPPRTDHAFTNGTDANTANKLDPSIPEQLETPLDDASSYTPERPSYFSRSTSMLSMPTTPGGLSRSPSWSGSIVDQDDLDAIPPLDRLTVLDFLENLALPQRLESLQNSISVRTEKMRRQQQKIRDSSKAAREKVIGEWRKRVPASDAQQAERYRKRIRESVDRFGRRWNESRTVSTREKVSFIAGVLNIFISGYIIGGFPEYFHIWYTAQLAYYYPIRFYTYRKRGYHYFLADLCYFVNFLLLLSIWAFPGSKRLFISTFCLAFGNNAVAIAMWRNSLVFHSVEKVTSLFIHIMPCATIHVLVHLIPTTLQASRFPAIHSIRTSLPGTPEHYSLSYMVIWATVPYAFWQLSYHFLITVRRREKIAAGRPTSFTWLRRSFAKTWIGKFVISLPENLQEPAFMLIQYIYALLTMLPTPIWFWSRWASAAFLMVVFTWSIYNGARYYIDVFGTRFQKELEKLKQDVARSYLSPEIQAKTPLQTPKMNLDGTLAELSLGDAAEDGIVDRQSIAGALATPGVDTAGMEAYLSGSPRFGASSGMQIGGGDEVQRRRVGEAADGENEAVNGAVAEMAAATA